TPDPAVPPPTPEAAVPPTTPQAASTADAATRVTASPLPAKLAYPLAVIAFVFYALAIPGTDVWPLAFVAFVPLLIALRNQPPRRALAVGLPGGFVGLCTAFYWLLGMLREFSDFPLPLCVLFMAILCAYQAGRFALWTWLTARATVRGWPFRFAFGLAFIA